MNPLYEITCRRCGRLLGRLDGRAELKCPRCKLVTVYDTSEKTLIASIDREVAKTHNISSEKTLIAGGRP